MTRIAMNAMPYHRVCLLPPPNDANNDSAHETRTKDTRAPTPPCATDHDDDGASSDSDDGPKKSVRWSTVTVYEFGVAIGGSAIPRHGGPSIGLARRPKSIWSATVDDVEDDVLSDHDHEDQDDDAWLQHIPVRSTSSASPPPRPIRNAVARRRRVRWLKPLERVQLLTNAGCSEKRIYRMLQETSDIAMSRRLSVSVLRDIAV